MKKLLLTCITSILLVVNSFSQSVGTGTILVDGYYGYGTLTSLLFKVIADANGISGGTYSNFGPVGARVEYMVSETFGVGFEANYTKSSASFKDVRSVYNNFTNSYQDVVYNYTLSNTRIRFMPRINLHFGQSDKFDGFFAVAAGYKGGDWRVSSNDPDFVASTASNIPLAFRMGLGGRYFLTEDFNLNMELGLSGGALLHFGVGVKL